MIGVKTLVESYSPYRTPKPTISSRRTWASVPLQKPRPKRPSQIAARRSRQSSHAFHNGVTKIMDSTNLDEMETFHRLSDQYQPNVQGPLVGEKQGMDVLVREYAHADPRYVAKTQALAATHSGYRPIKGDGQCGWRAAVFGYFEALLQSSDLHKIEQERIRLKNFDTTMVAAGIRIDMLEDMFDYTYELFDRIKAAIAAGDRSEQELLQAMNNETESSCILYHFKSMTSGYMQLNSDRYESFLEMSMLEYRQQHIEPANQEIDQIGLQALTDGIIGPAGIALDVAYLDRSVGDEVTPHSFAPIAPGWPAIHLLYRPGHYDMLYRPVPASQPLQVNILLRVETPSDMYYSPQPLEMDPFLHAFLAPNESVWQDPPPPTTYQSLQNHPVSMSMSYDNGFTGQYPYIPTSGVTPISPSALYGHSWSGPGPMMIPVTAAPVSAMSPASPQDQSVNEPKIRSNNYSLLVHNHQFPTLETGLPPGSSSTSHFNDANFEPEQYHPEKPSKKQLSKQKK